MLQRPTEKQLRAIIALRTRDEFSEILAWLDDSLHAQDIANRKLSGERLLQGQGKAQVMDEILSQFSTAPEDLSRVVAAGQGKAQKA